DVLAQHELAPERAVVELHLLVDAAVAGRPPPLAGDEQGLRGRDDLHLARVHPWELDEDGDLRRLPGAVAVDLRPESTAGGEARDLPQLGEEVVDLAAQPVDVAAARHGSQRTAGVALRRPPFLAEP